MGGEPEGKASVEGVEHDECESIDGKDNGRGEDGKIDRALVVPYHIAIVSVEWYEGKASLEGAIGEEHEDERKEQSMAERQSEHEDGGK